MVKGTIFDIKKYSIHDGPGIRTTVFFKGCPLRCGWCHNPEGQLAKPEIIVKPYRCLKGCDACLAVCEREALSKANKSLIIDKRKCDACGKCVDVCSSEALEKIGQKVSVQEVMGEIEKDMIFHDESGGGVTFSGGEPLAQPDFLNALLEKCKENDIHITLDTCGHAAWKTLEKVWDKVDLFLYDLKIMEEKKHREYTGQSNRLILENLKKLAKKGKKILIRIPLIPGINEDEENIQASAEFIRSLGNIQEISLLPYHRLGKDKYKRLRRRNSFPSLDLLSEERIKKIKKAFLDYKFNVTIGE